MSDISKQAISPAKVVSLVVLHSKPKFLYPRKYETRIEMSDRKKYLLGRRFNYKRKIFCEHAYKG